MVKVFFRILTVCLLSFTITLASCTNFKISNKDNSIVENSNDTSTEISSVYVNSEDEDIISGEQVGENNGIIIDEEYSKKEFPKIPTENISATVIKSQIGLNPTTHNLSKDQAKKLVDFLNASKFKITEFTKEDLRGYAGANLDITFKYEDGTLVELNDVAGYFSISLTEGYFQFPFSELINFCQFILGIELFNPDHDVAKEGPVKHIEPELKKGLAHNTVVDETLDLEPNVFPQIPSESLSKVTVITRAKAPNPTRIDLSNEQIETLFKFLNKIEFVPTDLTKENFAYDYGDYFRIIFDYSDGSTIQIAYDSYYHSSLNNGYFVSRNGDVDVILNEILQIKIYPYE